MSDKTMQIDGRTVELSSLDKVMYPDEGYTKEDVVDYYRRIAPTMVPHMREHPLNMQRFPDGIDAGGFYEKKLPDYFPDWIASVAVEVKESGESQRQVVCDSAAALVYLANQACLTPHLWLSRRRKPAVPDKLIFDLDPPEGSDDFAPIREAALRLHDALGEQDLTPYVMTTGSRGLHVIAPLSGDEDFDAVRERARGLAEDLAERFPDRFTTAISKKKRKGRLFLDYLRNSYGQTAVAPYALRPLPGAPVAAPLDWDELDQPDLHPRRYTLANIFRRLGQKEDPWKKLGHDA